MRQTVTMIGITTTGLSNHQTLWCDVPAGVRGVLLVAPGRQQQAWPPDAVTSFVWSHTATHRLPVVQGGLEISKFIWSRCTAVKSCYRLATCAERLVAQTCPSNSDQSTACRLGGRVSSGMQVVMHFDCGLDKRRITYANMTLGC